jgi:hypothetical protein
MPYARVIGRLRAVLVGLFTFAQIACVSPLIYEHTLDVLGAAQVGDHAINADHDGTASAAPNADHHHGILDLHDQCCALHTLAGPLPAVADVALANPLSVRMAPAALAALADTEPARLDRPPKPMPLI